MNIYLYKFKYFTLPFINIHLLAENDKYYFTKVTPTTGTTNYNVYQYKESSNGFETTDITKIMTYQKMTSPDNVYYEVNLSDSTLNTAITNWINFDCVKGECKPAYGFIKTKEATPKYIYMPYTGSNVVLTAESTPAFRDACSASGNVGLIDDHGILCITYDGSLEGNRVYGEMINNKVYIFDATVNTNGFAASGVIVIKATENSLTYSGIYADSGPNLFTSGVRISTAEIIDSGEDANKEALKLYNCLEDGTCTAIGGYAINERSFYSITSGGESDIATIAKAAACTGNVGKLINDGSGVYLCLTASLKIDATQNSFSVIGSPESTSVFYSATNLMVEISDNFIVKSSLFDGNIKNIIIFF